MYKIHINREAIQNILNKEEDCDGASFLVVQNGKELAYLQSGSINKETVFRIYSMTKPVIGYAVTKLIKQGVLNSDELAEKYIPTFKNKRITIQNLLDMTSGIGYNRDSNEVNKIYENASSMTTQEIASELGKCRLLFAPNTYWAYGADADVLGAIIERATDTPLDEYLKICVFQPLDMADTAFYAKNKMRLAKMQTNDFLGIKDNGNQTQFMSGGAGLFSTLGDYAKFAHNLLKHNIKIKTVKAFYGWENFEGYEYGNLLRVMKYPSISKYPSNFGEYGWFGWAGTFFFNDPLNHATVLIMMNKPDGEKSNIEKQIRYSIYKEE